VSPSTLPRALPRAVVGSLAALVVFALGTSPAGAVAGLTVPLSPPQVEVFLVPAENYAEVPVEDESGDGSTPVEVQWGGAVELQLPAGLDGTDAVVVLQTGSPDDEEPARTLSSDSDGADRLDVTDLGDGASRVALPADDGTGSAGVLSVEGLTAADPGIRVGDLYYFLQFTGTGAAVVPLAPQLSAYSSVPCALDLFAGPADCPPYPVLAGTTVGLTVPADSLLRTLGLGTLTDVGVALTPLDPELVDEGGYGFSDGYDDGYEAGFDAAPGTTYVAVRGPGYDATEAGTDAEYDADYAEGHAQGWADGALAAADPGTDDEDTTYGWAGMVGTLAELPEAVDEPLTAPAAEESMARVAEAARSVDEVVAAAAEPAEPVTEEVGAEPIVDGLLPVTVTAEGVEVTLPADTAAGEYELAVFEGDGLTGPSSVVVLTLDVLAPVAAAPVVAPVVAPPAAPAVVPVLNPGLASNTGWTEPAPGSSPGLVALGGAAVLAAGLGVAVVLRPRRRSAPAAQD
jgi:hypothetical protein